MTKKAYWELLRDPRWQRKRLEALERVDFECEACEARDKTLNVHHRLYRKGAKPWEYELTELRVLCEDCHEEEHHVRDRLAVALSQLDVDGLEEVLGYAQSRRATSEVFNDLPEDEQPSDREWTVETWAESRGFLVGLTAKVSFDDVEAFRTLVPINHRIVFGVSVHGLRTVLEIDGKN